MRVGGSQKKKWGKKDKMETNFVSKEGKKEWKEVKGIKNRKNIYHVQVKISHDECDRYA